MTQDPDPVGLRRRHTRSRSLDDQALHESQRPSPITSLVHQHPKQGLTTRMIRAQRSGSGTAPAALWRVPRQAEPQPLIACSQSQTGVSSDRWAGSYVTCVAAMSAANAATEAPRRAPATGGPHRAAPLPLPPIRGRRSLETEVSRSREPLTELGRLASSATW